MQKHLFLTPPQWEDYQLIDCGNFEKLERFGKYHLIRPEPQALWNKKMSDKEWRQLADAQFVRDTQKTSYRNSSTENGGWKMYNKIPNTWNIKYNLSDKTINCKLSLTTFGHIGIFPEQAENWRYIYQNIILSNIKDFKLLNVFAYTGAASIAAKLAGAEVTHVDAVKQVIGWANENMILSNTQNIRWIIDDALKFMRREQKRDKKYDAIIFDPPAYGRGPDGEKWILEDNINELLLLATNILSDRYAFVILNMYSLGYSSHIANNLITNYFHDKDTEFGEFYINSKTNIILPLGTFVRLKR